LVEKVEGAEMTCRSCGTDLVCREKDYGGNYKSSMQWQNEDGTAHYATKDGKNFTCNIPEGESTTPENESPQPEIPKETPQIPQTNSLDEDMRYVRNKIDLMFAMISEQFRDYTDRKNRT